MILDGLSRIIEIRTTETRRSIWPTVFNTETEKRTYVVRR